MQLTKYQYRSWWQLLRRHLFKQSSHYKISDQILPSFLELED